MNEVNEPGVFEWRWENIIGEGAGADESNGGKIMKL